MGDQSVDDMAEYIKQTFELRVFCRLVIMNVFDGNELTEC